MFTSDLISKYIYRFSWFTNRSKFISFVLVCSHCTQKRHGHDTRCNIGQQVISSTKTMANCEENMTKYVVILRPRLKHVETFKHNIFKPTKAPKNNSTAKHQGDSTAMTCHHSRTTGTLTSSTTCSSTFSWWMRLIPY